MGCGERGCTGVCLSSHYIITLLLVFPIVAFLCFHLLWCFFMFCLFMIDRYIEMFFGIILVYIKML